MLKYSEENQNMFTFMQQIDAFVVFMQQFLLKIPIFAKIHKYLLQNDRSSRRQNQR